MDLILKRTHKRLTIISTLSILPLLICCLATILLMFFSITLMRDFLEFILLLPPLMKGLLWLFLPLVGAVIAYRCSRNGSLESWRGYNRLTYKTATFLLVMILLVSVVHFFI